ncbi:hypothetical protein F5051DRAFT_114947 [Lentinula edodes]|nr:hypothetical protein F5051DRAFT_114947 [Lentinula edodes]
MVHVMVLLRSMPFFLLALLSILSLPNQTLECRNPVKIPPLVFLNTRPSPSLVFSRFLSLHLLPLLFGDSSVGLSQRFAFAVNDVWMTFVASPWKIDPAKRSSYEPRTRRYQIFQVVTYSHIPSVESRQTRHIKPQYLF